MMICVLTSCCCYYLNLVDEHLGIGRKQARDEEIVEGASGRKGGQQQQKRLSKNLGQKEVVGVQFFHQGRHHRNANKGGKHCDQNDGFT